MFYVECGAVLRRWDLNTILTPEVISAAMVALMAWPLRVVQVRGLLADAWRRRANITFPDAIYVALAEHLGADLLTNDQKLAITPSCRYGRSTFRLDPEKDRHPHANDASRRRVPCGIWASSAVVATGPTRSARVMTCKSGGDERARQRRTRSRAGRATA